MLMKEIIAAYDVLDSSFVTGEEVKKYLLGIKADANVEVYELVGPKGSTDMLKVRIPGRCSYNRTPWQTWRNWRTSGTYWLCI